MNETDMAIELQKILVECMDKWSQNADKSALTRMRWENLDPTSKALFTERCRVFLERYRVERR